MKLVYYKDEKNFGDSLNPLIFGPLLGDILDENVDEYFIGIGSILGFDLTKRESKKYVFSSGFAYGEIPKIDGTYNILCIRGPLTAIKLGIDQSRVIADAAILLPKIYPYSGKKIYSCSFMPHHKSLHYFDLKGICNSLGIHYIDPSGDPLNCAKEISQSELIITEAMHGAIVADAYRVRWIPIDIYGINLFKWHDWMLSLGLKKIKIFKLPRLYTQSIVEEKINRRLGLIFVRNLSRIFVKIVIFLYIFFQKKKVIFFYAKLYMLSKGSGFLSKDEILCKKQSELLLCLNSFKRMICH